MDCSVVLAAGRDVPTPGNSVSRGEGVAIVSAIQAWQAAGKQWKVCGSRLVLGCLQVGSKPKDRLHVLRCYAPTRTASRSTKYKFFDEAISAIPSSE